MKPTKKIIPALYFLPLLFWLGLTALDVYGQINLDTSPVYWRAWEYVSNYTGKDGLVALFKPWRIYNGPMAGDLLNALDFQPRASEVKKQEFIVDEYGYRNQPHFLDQPVDAVVIGSSFVGGARETQADTLSEILTRKHSIRTYNSTASVQYLWEDYRFASNPPKYVIIVGPEGEIIQSLWKYGIEDRIPLNVPQKWESYEDWKLHNQLPPDSFEKYKNSLRDYSLVRYFSIQLRVRLKNRLYSREVIARQTTQTMVTYDPTSEMLYFQEDYDVPILGSTGKTKEDIQTAILALKKTRDRLAERNMRLIVVPMPSKTHVHMEKYRNLPDEQRALVLLNAELKKNDVEFIDMFTPVRERQKTTNAPLYYPDDSHWSSETNYLIGEQVAKYLKTHPTRRKNR